MNLILSALVVGISLAACCMQGYALSAPVRPQPGGYVPPNAGCPDGWTRYGMSCYWFNPGNWRSIWMRAQKFCQMMGGDLVKIDGAKENNFITEKQKTYPHERWIGLRSSSPKNFSWVDGSSLSTNWKPDVAFDSVCVAVSGRASLPTGKWEVHNCMESKSFICEKDVDPCLQNPPPCDKNAECTNTVGSYKCECKPGFTGDGKTCKAIKWEPEGCYKPKKKKSFEKKPFFVASVEQTKLLMKKGEFKAAFTLCKNAAEKQNIPINVIGVGMKSKGKKQQLACMTTKNGEPPKSGKYIKNGGKGKCQTDKEGYGVGIKPKVYFVYIKA